MKKIIFIIIVVFFTGFLGAVLFINQGETIYEKTKIFNDNTVEFDFELENSPKLHKLFMIDAVGSQTRGGINNDVVWEYESILTMPTGELLTNKTGGASIETSGRHNESTNYYCIFKIKPKSGLYHLKIKKRMIEGADKIEKITLRIKKL